VQILSQRGSSVISEVREECAATGRSQGDAEGEERDDEEQEEQARNPARVPFLLVRP
jgi:predicted transposase YdaD